MIKILQNITRVIIICPQFPTLVNLLIYCFKLNNTKVHSYTYKKYVPFDM